MPSDVMFNTFYDVEVTAIDTHGQESVSTPITVCIQESVSALITVYMYTCSGEFTHVQNSCTDQYR